MASNRTINTKLFKDRWVRSLSPLDKLLFIYFLTNIATNIAGAYEIELSDVELDTGLTSSEIDSALQRFRDDEKVFYEDGWVYIANFIKHQAYENPRIQTGIAELINNSPSWIKYRVYSAYNSLSHLILLDSILFNSIDGAVDKEEIKTEKTDAPRTPSNPFPINQSSDLDLPLTNGGGKPPVQEIFLGTVESGLAKRMGILTLPNQREWHQKLAWAFKNHFSAADVLECYDLLKKQDFWHTRSITAKTLIDNLANIKTLKGENGSSKPNRPTGRELQAQIDREEREQI